MDVKTCKQCGELKPISLFRQYYGGRRGTYKMCKDCERINSREKYLAAKGASRTEAEETELNRIHELYDCQRAVGLQPPTKRGGNKPLTNDLNDMLAKYKNMAVQASESAQDISVADAPAELMKWLTEPLLGEPDEYIDEVYERLVEKYRPCTGIDKATMMPVYDNKYKAILDKILERFTDYEDSYYEGNE
jgi:hypothetical protein